MGSFGVFGVGWIALLGATLGIPLCLFLKERAPLETVRKLEMEDNTKGQTVAKSGKSLIVAYVLWILLFPLGAHRFYLGRRKSAVVILLLSLSFFFSRFFLVSLPFPMLLDPETVFLEFFSILDLIQILDAISRALLFTIIVWWPIDAFRIRKLARRG